MQQYDFRRAGKKCAIGERPLMPGEVYYSALVELPDGQLSRVDYSEEHWDPEGEFVGSWKQQVSDLETGKVYWAPPEVLLAYFKHQLEKQQHELAFVMSLLLLQKRILQFKESIDDDEGTVSILAAGRSSEIFEVRDIEIGADKTQTIQQELAEHLFSSQPFSAADESES